MEKMNVLLSVSNSKLLLVTKVRKKMSCSLCGGDHWINHCIKLHNGLGQIMNSTEKNNTMKVSFLIVEIKQDGKTILPKTFEAYNIRKL